MKQRILILDLLAVLHTIKFSLGKNRLSENEKHTFIIYGFLMKLNFLIKKTGANQIVFALDSHSSKRKELYPTYKEKRGQNRTEQQIILDNLAHPQFEKIIDYVLPTIGYRNLFGSEGFEADDSIGRICKKYPNEQIVICSTDHDMYMLLTNNVCMLNAKTNNYYTITDFEREFKIPSKMWKRVKAMGGCASDNIKGVEIPKSDPTKKQMHVAQTGALNYLTGKMKSTTKAYKAIESRAGKNIINRNKALVILPMRGTPDFTIRPDHPSLRKFIQLCVEYQFDAILENIHPWKQVLKLK
ncbi:MAG: hypothetical protein P9L97_06265 [Candidatus Tenebribacter davisii]|nr:hypothetical protein [Candidatus Tenebribacter davisii]